MIWAIRLKTVIMKVNASSVVWKGTHSLNATSPLLTYWNPPNNLDPQTLSFFGGTFPTNGCHCDCPRDSRLPFSTDTGLTVTSGFVWIRQPTNGWSKNSRWVTTSPITIKWKKDESDEELDGNLVIETSYGENKSDSDDEELDSENTSDSNGDNKDLGSFPLTEAASLAIAALPEETEGKRKTFFSGSHPALDELLNESMGGGRKRSVSASSCGRDKQKDNRPSPP